MEITFHIILLVILAGLFFINKFSPSSNALLFIIVLGGVGLISISQSDTYIFEGLNNTGSYDSSLQTFTSTTTPIETSFNYEWFLIVSYLVFILVAMIGFSLGGEYDLKKE